jgi:hypothetical protein
MKTIICLDGETWALADGPSILCISDAAYYKLADGEINPEDIDELDIMSETILHFPC